jgi:hypothetical protein
MIDRRTFLQGATALAATQIMPGRPAVASPAMTLWQDSKDEYFRRVRLCCQTRFRTTMALCMNTDGPFHEYASFFLYASKIWSHIRRNTLDQIELTTDRPAAIQVIEAVDAEVLKWMTIAAEYPVKHPWLESFPSFVKPSCAKFLFAPRGRRSHDLLASRGAGRGYHHPSHFRSIGPAGQNPGPDSAFT